MLIRLSLALLWLLHFLPLPLLRGLGSAFGLFLWAVGRERRRVTQTNLRLCFPELSEAQRNRLTRDHFRYFGKSFMDRALLWHASAERLRRLIRFSSPLPPAENGPYLVFSPHFVGMDAAWTGLTLQRQMLAIYSSQKNPVFDAALYAGRTRFNQPNLLSRQDGIRQAIKGLREIPYFYYLPDMDFGPKNAMFIPFFGTPAATITALPWLAGLAKAKVLPCLAEMTESGYTIHFLPPWTDYPSGDVEADTRRMNSFIEEQVRRWPAQYYWLHKRFKTRPPGDPKLY